MEDKKISNPFPIGGLAERESFYYPYWKENSKDYDEFIQNLNSDKTQFLVITGPWGSGKTATLFYIEDQINKRYNNVLVLYWNLSPKPPDKSFAQAFYLDFLTELRSKIIEKKIKIKLAATDFKIEYDFLNNLTDDQNYRLHHLLETYQSHKDMYEDGNRELKEKTTDAWQAVRNYIKTIDASVELDQRQINEIGYIMLKSWSALFDLEIDLQDHQITMKMQEIFKKLNEDFECVVLLVDEFDVLIREVIKEKNLEEIRRFILLFAKESYKGYHLVGAFHDENIPRLCKDNKDDPLFNIKRRLYQCQIILQPPRSFEDFYNHIYKDSLYEKEDINRKFDLFDKRFLHLLYYLSKENLGIIFRELHSKFNLWEEEINDSFKEFKKLELASKIEDFFPKMSRYDLIWSDKRGIYQGFSQEFIKIINNDEINTDNRKSIFNKLISIDSIEDSAFTYEQIANDLGLSNKKIVKDFHNELLSEKQLSTVFPKYEDRFYISYSHVFTIFNFSRSTQPRQEFTALKNFEDQKDKNFIHFIRFFSVSTNLNLTKTEIKNTYYNEGFRHFIEDYLIRTNPLGNRFVVKPNIKPYNLIELVKNYISNDLLKNLTQYELEIQRDFYSEFKLRCLLIKLFDEDKREEIIQQFLLVFLPIYQENSININRRFISLFEEFLKETDSTNNNFDSIIIFGGFNYDPSDYNEWIKLFNTNSSDKPWIHLIDRIIPIQIEFQSILKDDIYYLSRNSVPFNIICAAFYVLHNITPQKQNITYNKILFDHVNNDDYKQNIDSLTGFLNNIFEKYRNIFQGANHDPIDLEENKESTETKIIDFFPLFLSNLSDFFKTVIPISQNGKIFRSEIGEAFNYGVYDTKDLKTCLYNLLETDEIKMDPSISSRKKKKRFLQELNVYKALIEVNFLYLKISQKEYIFNLRTDPNSLFHYFDELVTINMEEDKVFTIVDFLNKIKLPVPKFKKKPDFIEIMEILFDFLKKNRRIFEHYPMEEEGTSEVSIKTEF